VEGWRVGTFLRDLRGFFGCASFSAFFRTFSASFSSFRSFCRLAVSAFCASIFRFLVAIRCCLNSISYSSSFARSSPPCRPTWVGLQPAWIRSAGAFTCALVAILVITSSGRNALGPQGRRRCTVAHIVVLHLVIRSRAPLRWSSRRY
jgi:hypothetical protein